MGRYVDRNKADMQRLNGQIRKAAKAAKKSKWLDRKIKKKSKPKRTLKNYGRLDDD